MKTILVEIRANIFTNKEIKNGKKTRNDTYRSNCTDV